MAQAVVAREQLRKGRKKEKEKEETAPSSTKNNNNKTKTTKLQQKTTRTGVAHLFVRAALSRGNE